MVVKRKYWNILDDTALARLLNEPRELSTTLSYTEWIRVLRNYLRMTQEELANRSHIPRRDLCKVAFDCAATNPIYSLGLIETPLINANL